MGHCRAQLIDEGDSDEALLLAYGCHRRRCQKEGSEDLPTPAHRKLHLPRRQARGGSGPTERIQPHCAVVGDPCPLPRRLLPDKPTVLEVQQLPQLVGDGDEDELRFLSPGDALSEVVKP